MSDAHAERLASGHAELARYIPGWDDPEQRAQLQQRIVHWARRHGWTTQQLNDLVEPDAVLGLFKQMVCGRG